MEKRRRFSRLAILLPVFLALISGCAGNAYAQIGNDLSTMQENILATEDISARLVEICNWQIEDSKQHWADYDKAIKNGTTFDRGDSDDKDVEEKYDEPSQQIQVLETIASSFTPATPAGQDAFDQTAGVYTQYLTDLRLSAADMKTMFDYYFEMREALKPFEEFAYAESTTGYTDYALMAGQLSQIITQTQKALKDVACPPFMKSSHDALVLRIDEMQSFSQDFSIAVQMGDVLRLSSSVYRSERISKLIDQGDRRLDEDFSLQFQQTADRLTGRAAQMREELLKNIAVLNAAIA